MSTLKTVENELISRINSLRYSIQEPLQLKIARSRYEKFYEPPLAEAEPLISVYTPTYNRGPLLMERAVESVLKQTYKNFEFVIIGDHCTDNTAELVSKINDPRIRFHNIPSRGYRYPPSPENHWFAGPVIASNTALDRVRGKWIARIDDDDTWTPDHLEVLLKFAQSGNHEFVSAQYLEERIGVQRLDTGVPANDPYYTRAKVPPKVLGPKIGGTSTWMYRSYLKFFRYNIHCWRKSWNRVNDIDLSQRIYQAGVRMGFTDHLITFVFPRPGEQTVGLDAYKAAGEDKMKLYEFKD